jgi:hypothetical protein
MIQITFHNAVQEVKLKSIICQHKNMSVEKLRSGMGKEQW